MAQPGRFWRYFWHNFNFILRITKVETLGFPHIHADELLLEALFDESYLFIFRPRLFSDAMMNPMDNQLRELHVDEDKSYTLSTRLRPNSDNLVVFLHGWGGSRECFTHAFSSDALQGYGICTIDLLGFGASEKPEDFYDAVAKIIQDA